MAFELGIISDEVDDDLPTALGYIRAWDLRWIELRAAPARPEPG